MSAAIPISNQNKKKATIIFLGCSSAVDFGCPKKKKVLGRERYTGKSSHLVPNPGIHVCLHLRSCLRWVMGGRRRRRFLLPIAANSFNSKGFRKSDIGIEKCSMKLSASSLSHHKT